MNPVNTSRPLGDFSPPLSVGHHRIEELLGLGGMGAVYRARDERLQRDVAIKFWNTQEGDARSGLLREAQLLARINHPGVVQVFDVVDDESYAAVVLEHVPGIDLASLAERPSVERCIQLALGITEGLAAAHAKGVIHRDLSPANILLTPDGQTKLTDFGIASLEGDFDRPGSRVAGSLHCMSPEQLRSDELDFRSDLFSLGCILYWLLSGQFPAGKFLAPTAVLGCLERRTWPDLSALRSDLSPELVDLVNRLLAPDTMHRLQSAAEVLDLLGDLQSSFAPAESEVAESLSSDGPDTSFVTAAMSVPASPGRYFRSMLALGLLVTLAAGAVKYHIPPEHAMTRTVAVVAPTLQNPEHVADVRLMKTAVHKAVIDGMSLSIQVELLPVERLPVLGADPVDLVSALQVDELVASHMDCTAAFCNVSLRRYGHADLLELADVQVPLDSYGVMHERLVTAVPRLYIRDHQPR